MKELYFISNNEKKYEEMKEIVEHDGIKLKLHKHNIEEIQTEDPDELIRHKALTAFKEIRRPVLVEHTALTIDAFKNLPGLQTSYFYSKLGYEEIVNYCNYKQEYGAYVESFFCICDGKRFLISKGKEEGTITCSKERVDKVVGFAWDKIFIPTKDNPNEFTYAELGKRKNERSMRKNAWDKLKKQYSSELNEFLKEGKEENLEELAKLIRERKVLLFIGAGISASIGFPTWNSLISELGKKQGYEDRIFNCYGDNMMLAEYVSLENSEEVYEQIERIFKVTPEIKNKLLLSEIYELIYKLDFPVIYTTNYDALLETYYFAEGRDFDKVVNIEDMKETDLNRTRIMKFHGDIDDRESIVLSESQYFKRMDFQHFMDVQLQADMLKYHILFLGYSLADINVKLLLYYGRKRNNDKMQAYIYTSTPNQVQKDVFNKNGITTFSGRDAEKQFGTLQFLKKLVKLVED